MAEITLSGHAKPTTVMNIARALRGRVIDGVDFPSDLDETVWLIFSNGDRMTVAVDELADNATMTAIGAAMMFSSLLTDSGRQELLQALRALPA